MNGRRPLGEIDKGYALQQDYTSGQYCAGLRLPDRVATMQRSSALSTERTFFSRLRSRLGGAPGGPDQATLDATTMRKFLPSCFTWTDRVSGAEICVHVNAECMRLRKERAVAEMRVEEHGIDIVAVLDGSESSTTVYLGNHFIVPPHLKRRGLATSVLLAFVQIYQLTRFGVIRPDQRLMLEGYFVGEGSKFAAALCVGVLPTKAAPAAIDLSQLNSSQSMFRLHLGTGVMQA